MNVSTELAQGPIPADSTPAGGQLPLLLIVTLSSVLLTVLICAVLAVVVGCICWRCHRHHNRTQTRRIVFSDSFVVENRFPSVQLQVQSIQRLEYHHPNNFLAEQGSDSSSSSSCTGYPTPESILTPLQPSQAHPLPLPTHPHHTPSQPPYPPHSLCIIDPLHDNKSCHSDPDGIINSHPHMASTLPKSHSFHGAFSYETTRLSATNLSRVSSPVSHTPYQVTSAASSPANGRGSVLRRFMGSIRSTVSGYSIASGSEEEETFQLAHYETPV